MIKYLIKGKIIDTNGKPLGDLYSQAMDSDQGFFEDHNDDLLGSSRTAADGSFEIAFDDSTFSDSWLEKSPEIYLIVRNEDGQILHRTEKVEVKSDEITNGTVNIQANITLDSKQKKTSCYKNCIPRDFSQLANIDINQNKIRNLKKFYTLNQRLFILFNNKSLISSGEV
jgi:hypothetical protein